MCVQTQRMLVCADAEDVGVLEACRMCLSCRIRARDILKVT